MRCLSIDMFSLRGLQQSLNKTTQLKTIVTIIAIISSKAIDIPGKSEIIPVVKLSEKRKLKVPDANPWSMLADVLTYAVLLALIMKLGFRFCPKQNFSLFRRIVSNDNVRFAAILD